MHLKKTITFLVTMGVEKVGAVFWSFLFFAGCSMMLHDAPLGPLTTNPTVPCHQVPGAVFPTGTRQE